MVKGKSKKSGLKNDKRAFALLEDVLMIAIGMFAAVALSRIGFIDNFTSIFKDHYQIPSLIAGMFFTSFFTLGPSSVALVHISQAAPISGVVVWGGIGAMLGDLILFFFIRDRFVNDLRNAIKPRYFRAFMRSMHFGFMKWISPVIGALIIASPLPDELGISLLGMSKVRLSVLIPVALFMNMLGIYILIEFSHFL
jgi:uncharacterized membrane protein YjfL (UPF0719 family)